MKIAAAYIRVSTEEQTELSPDSQLKLIQEYAKSHDFVIPSEFVFSDEGISGRKAEKRPAFMKMIATSKAKPKPFDVILVWKYSRFARNREDSVVYKSMLRKQCGVEVISISEQLGEDKTSMLIEAMLEAMDEYYSINLGEEVKRGMLEKVERGGCVASPAYGYDIVNGKYVINELEAENVKYIFNQFINGVGLREIAIDLNRKNILTKRGNRWENRVIEYILNNPIYIGKIRWNTDGKTSRNFHSDSIIIKDGTHSPIIDENAFKEAAKLLAKNKMMYPKNAHTVSKHEYMLRGLVRCSNCMSTLTRVKSGLQCHSYARGKCLVSHYISFNVINEMVLNTIQFIFDSGMDFIILRKSAQSNQDEVNDEIQKELYKLKRVKEAYELGIDSIDEYRSNKIRIEESIQKLKSKISPKIDESTFRKEFIKKNKAVLKQLRSASTSEHEKNMLLRSFVDHIVFNRENTSVSVFFYA